MGDLRRGKMNLILSDRNLDFCQTDHFNGEFIDLSKLNIANCIGCFGCWTKTPGKCVIRDDAVKVYPLIAASERVLYVSRVKYGGYDTVMKTMLERSIPVQQAFIRLLHGETHHVQRNVVAKEAVIIGYGAISPEEEEIFCRLIERNAKNMNFKTYRTILVCEDELEKTVKNEVDKWEKS